jgi:hypothetical protein
MYVTTNNKVVNYNGTFAPALDLDIACLILALSVIWQTPARHGDTLAAYTKAIIESDSDIYMYPPTKRHDTYKKSA